MMHELLLRHILGLSRMQRDMQLRRIQRRMGSAMAVGLAMAMAPMAMGPAMGLEDSCRPSSMLLVDPTIACR